MNESSPAQEADFEPRFNTDESIRKMVEDGVVEERLIERASLAAHAISLRFEQGSGHSLPEKAACNEVVGLFMNVYEAGEPPQDAVRSAFLSIINNGVNTPSAAVSTRMDNLKLANMIKILARTGRLYGTARRDSAPSFKDAFEYVEQRTKKNEEMFGEDWALANRLLDHALQYGQDVSGQSPSQPERSLVTPQDMKFSLYSVLDLEYSPPETPQLAHASTAPNRVQTESEESRIPLSEADIQIITEQALGKTTQASGNVLSQHATDSMRIVSEFILKNQRLVVESTEVAESTDIVDSSDKLKQVLSVIKERSSAELKLFLENLSIILDQHPAASDNPRISKRAKLVAGEIKPSLIRRLLN